MSSPVPTVGAIPWYKSPQLIILISALISAAVAFKPAIAVELGLETPEKVNVAVTALFGSIAGIALVIGGIMRVASKTQPITLTQSDADIHPSTIKAEKMTLMPTPIPMDKVDNTTVPFSRERPPQTVITKEMIQTAKAAPQVSNQAEFARSVARAANIAVAAYAAADAANASLLEHLKGIK